MQNHDLTAGFQTITSADAKVVKMLQDMMDFTFENKATRDRPKDAPMPKRLAVQMVQRVENSRLWVQYITARASIKAKRPHKCTSLNKPTPVKTMQNPHAILSGVDNHVNEVYLWHGTSPVAAASIAKTGFNMDMVGKTTGTMFGNGVYFAESSSKSDEYAKADSEGLFPGLCCLILCRVVMGESISMGQGGEKVHNTIYAALEGGAFESILGDRAAAVGTYREFMVYTAVQMYPEYIVMYKRE